MCSVVPGPPPKHRHPNRKRALSHHRHSHGRFLQKKRSHATPIDGGRSVTLASLRAAPSGFPSPPSVVRKHLLTLKLHAWCKACESVLRVFARLVAADPSELSSFYLLVAVFVGFAPKLFLELQARL